MSNSPLRIGVIPSRYASQRLPGKPLIDLCGKTMLERVWLAAVRSQNLDAVIIATDDERIETVARGFGADVELTSPALESGTDRCYAAVIQRGLQPDIVVNIQGDEPLLQPTLVDALVKSLEQSTADVATAYYPLAEEERADNSVVKIVISENGIATGFSRQPVQTPWKHLGLYAYRWRSLLWHIQKAPSESERAEKLEQLRLFEAGAVFTCCLSTSRLIAVDTSADAERVRTALGC